MQERAQYELAISWIRTGLNEPTEYKLIGMLALSDCFSDEAARQCVVPIINALIAVDAHYHFSLTRWQTNGDEVKLPHR